MNSLLLALVTPLFANIEMCHTGSACTQCDDSSRVVFIANAQTQRVFVSASTSKDGEDALYLGDCNVKDANNWTCMSTVSKIEVVDGRIQVTQPGRDNPKREVCVR
jgi:hypothetical protein